ncbi:MAG: DUF4363 family protein [Clostridiales bacterium]|nr:DUF4363 family protein [Clostridiales bacterium]
MKREYIAAALITAIFVISVFNTHYVENKTRALTEDIESAEQLYNSGDGSGAASIVEDSMQKWLGWDSYAHIMLRHSEVDLVTDAYFELLSDLQSGETVPKAAFGKLKEQLHSISIMEKITIGSIF